MHMVLNKARTYTIDGTIYTINIGNIYCYTPCNPYQNKHVTRW
jgi:hypothetical protein